ncbi:MAG: hypothetical protein KKA43_01570, partial [Nanoarchaeota archaeon]|nr:hypothetical protein [Nanoarchaeota archaeon]
MGIIENCKTKKCISYFIFILIIIISGITAVKYVSALPPLPTEFYGRITDYNSNASPGELVRAYDNDGVLCGSFTIVNRGFYGSLTCKGDDPETVEDEGATAGENITFKFKTGYTTVTGDNTIGYGEFKYVNLTFPIVHCGDDFCDVIYENAITCPEDCPLYNASYNYTTNATNTSVTGGGAGGGGIGSGEVSVSGSTSVGGSSSGSLGFTPSYYLNYTGFDLSGFEGVDMYCREEWVCGNWSKCAIDGFQNRTCRDMNDCGTFDDKLPEIQRCIYTPTCFDGVRNGLEEGIDCGGLCAPCIGCFDNIQNCHDGLCEEGVDCGGPCSPCPTCFDGKQNCHEGMCEQGVDCGGPCDINCPEVQLPLGKFVCKKDFNPLSNQSIIFFIIMLLLIIGDVIYSRRKIKEIGKNKKISDIGRAKAILSTKRRMYLFIIIIILLS